MVRIRTRKLWIAVVLSGVWLWATDSGSSREIDTDRSVMTVRVLKAGLFSAFGHEHEISAPIQRGSFSETVRRVELAIDARRMRVIDQDVSEKDRAEIQATMLGPKVLDAERFPEIRFHSTAVGPLAGGGWTVQGELTIHGQTRPVKLAVKGENGNYQGTAELKQKDFGITPVTIGGGAVKVKNELRVEFRIVAKR